MKKKNITLLEKQNDLINLLMEEINNKTGGFYDSEAVAMLNDIAEKLNVEYKKAKDENKK